MSESTSSLERVFSLIELFLSKPQGLKVQEILADTEISRSTLFTLLKELKELGVIEQGENRGPYQIGPRLVSWLGANKPGYQLLINGFHQETRQKQYKESVALAAPAPQGILILDQVESIHNVRSVYAIGEPLQPDSAAWKLLNAPITTEITKQGYAFCEHEERLELALPICQDGVKPDAAIICHAPSYRWQKAAFIDIWLPMLRTMAAHLSYRLGAMTYTPFQSDSPLKLQPTAVLNQQEIGKFLQGPWTARLACLRPDGNPHVIPVWQEWSGNSFYVLAWQGSQWAEYVQKNPQVSLTVDEPWPPLQRVVVRGAAEKVEDFSESEKQDLLNRMTERYLGSQAAVLLQQQVQSIFRIKPDSIKGWSGLPTSLPGRSQ